MAQTERAQLHALKSELICLDSGASPEMKPWGLGTVRFVAICDRDAEGVVERVKTVLRVINHHSENWPSDTTWRDVLPDWFVAYCVPEKTVEESEAWLARWRKLSDSKKREAEEVRGWSLSNWLYWMTPENRQWYWWDAAVIPEGVAVAAVVMDWPFPWGALAWLFKAAGARSVIAEP